MKTVILSLLILFVSSSHFIYAKKKCVPAFEAHRVMEFDDEERKLAQIELVKDGPSNLGLKTKASTGDGFESLLFHISKRKLKKVFVNADINDGSIIIQLGTYNTLTGLATTLSSIGAVSFPFFFRMMKIL